MIRVMVVEDEPLAAQFLEALLTRTGKVEVVGRAGDATSGIARCAALSPDAVFLDIGMPGSSGLQLAAKLSRLAKPPMVVFTTGRQDGACEVFRLEAVDYLLKPLDPDQVHQAVMRLEDRLARGQGATVKGTTFLNTMEGRLPVKDSRDEVVKLLSKWEIVAACHRERRTWLHTGTEEFATYYKLKDLHAWLGQSPFVRISRESIVNLQSIGEVVRYGDRLYQVRIKDRVGTVLDVSRSGAQHLAELLKSPL